MPRDPRLATEPDEYDEDMLEREDEPVDEDIEAEDGDLLSVGHRAARVVLATYEALARGDRAEARRRLKEYDRLWPRLAGLVEDAEAATEGNDG